MVQSHKKIDMQDHAPASLFGDLSMQIAEDDVIHRRGSPPWIITFADMITLLLAFYVLMLSFSDMNINRFKDVSGSLNESLGNQEALPIVEAPAAETQLVAGPEPVAVPLPEQLAKDLGTLQKSLSADLIGQKLNVRVDNGNIIVDLPKHSGNGVLSQEMLDLYAKIAEIQSQVETTVEVREGTDSAAKINDAVQRLDQLKAALSKEIANGDAQVERDGERVVVRMLVQGSFYSGSAVLSPDYFPLLIKIGNTIAKGGGRITIEGHTDSIPVSGNDRYRSNWDLSGARAASVADFLIERGGVPRERMVVRGMADIKPLAPNDTREGRAKNRRIEVLIDAYGP
ncbi:MAG: OmpA family protein [Burkholderiales bacterium]|jgi:chemotaxis protein MotB|nr:OmpA family protein [Burkholderiales bacterium]